MPHPLAQIIKEANKEHLHIVPSIDEIRDSIDPSRIDDEKKQVFGKWDTFAYNRVDDGKDYEWIPFKDLIKERDESIASFKYYKKKGILPSDLVSKLKVGDEVSVRFQVRGEPPSGHDVYYHNTFFKAKILEVHDTPLIPNEERTYKIQYEDGYIPKEKIFASPYNIIPGHWPDFLGDPEVPREIIWSYDGYIVYDGLKFTSREKYKEERRKWAFNKEKGLLPLDLEKLKVGDKVSVLFWAEAGRAEDARIDDDLNERFKRARKFAARVGWFKGKILKNEKLKKPIMNSLWGNYNNMFDVEIITEDHASAPKIKVRGGTGDERVLITVAGNPNVIIPGHWPDFWGEYPYNSTESFAITSDGKLSYSGIKFDSVDEYKAHRRDVLMPTAPDIPFPVARRIYHNPFAPLATEVTQLGETENFRPQQLSLPPIDEKINTLLPTAIPLGKRRKAINSTLLPGDHVKYLSSDGWYNGIIKHKSSDGRFHLFNHGGTGFLASELIYQSRPNIYLKVEEDGKGSKSRPKKTRKNKPIRQSNNKKTRKNKPLYTPSAPPIIETELEKQEREWLRMHAKPSAPPVSAGMGGKKKKTRKRKLRKRKTKRKKRRRTKRKRR